MPQMHWKCPDCSRTLSIDDWTYAYLADRGIPVCGGCDRDMELIHPSDGSDEPRRPFNAWIIVDTDDRSVVPCVYDRYDECASDANAMDNALIVGLALPGRNPPDQQPEEEEG
jgi:hypothetical protein